MTQELEIFPLGSTAIVAGDIEVTIIAVTIYAGGGMMYNVVWWNDGNRQESWVRPCELKSESNRVPVGFVK